MKNWVPLFQRLLLGNRLFRGCKLIIKKLSRYFFFKIIPLLKIFDDEDGNGGGQMKSDDLKTMTTIGQRALPVCFCFFFMDNYFGIRETIYTPVNVFVCLCCK